MKDIDGIVGLIDSLAQVERCLECGHPWLNDEPAHHADCRYYFLEEEIEDEDANSRTLLNQETL